MYSLSRWLINTFEPSGTSLASSKYPMRYHISEHGVYLRAVISGDAAPEEFASLYRDLQRRCASSGCARALVVVRPESLMPGPERLMTFAGAEFLEGFKLALVCATWTLYRACINAEKPAAQAGIKVRAFLQEMEGVVWLLS